MAVAIEDAGFEIRDQIMWIYGSGFPKSLDVSKAIDKAAGAERKVVGKHPNPQSTLPKTAMGDNWQESPNITAPSTPEAQQWQGWGTALKPAHEPIVVARKPIVGTVANNVLTYGTGALNIDGSRVPSDDTLYRSSSIALPENQNMHIGWQSPWKQDAEKVNAANKRTQEKSLIADQLGRWPANVIHDGSEEVLEYFGDPQRFFYCAKASKAERNAGLEGLPERRQDEDDYERAGTTNPRNRSQALRQNFHPTVKPLALMRYLIKLVTPPNGLVLDPFLGSGSTAVAAILEGFNWVGCEMTEDYWPIIEARVAWAQKQQERKLL